MDKELVIVTAVVMLAAPFATTMAGANADDNATWGLCQADDANDQGDNSSNGTVGETPPFANLTEEDCEEAEHPSNGTPGEDNVPEDPGGDEAGEDEEDHPDEDDNPGDDRGDRSDEGDNQGEDEGDERGDDPDERP